MEFPSSHTGTSTVRKGRIASIILWWVVVLLLMAEVLSAGFSLHSRMGDIYRMERDLRLQLANTPQAPTSILPVLDQRTLGKARTVEEILRSLESSDSDMPSPPPFPIDPDQGPPPLAPFMSDEPVTYSREDLSTGDNLLDQLIKEARAAQIEGDMRKAILKLEEALSQHANHPAVLYYMGLTYEMLHNSTQARDYYTKVFQQREAAGPFYAEAARKLQAGFDLAIDMRGKISFGPIRVFNDPDRSKGESVVLTLPILLAPDADLRPEDLYIPIQFFDIINDREIALTRSEDPEINWLSESVDWKSGEEQLEIRYFMPTLSAEEVMALGDVRYYGYTAKLYYKGELMDCKASPNPLILLEEKIRRGSDYDPDDSLLPPIEAERASDSLLPLFFDDSALPTDHYLPPHSR